MSVKFKTKAKAKSVTNTQPAYKEFGFVWPDFDSPEAMNKWLNSFPMEDAKVDPRLRKRIVVELTLHQFMIDGFNDMARQQGLKNGKELMYAVLSQYLSANLPEEF